MLLSICFAKKIITNTVQTSFHFLWRLSYTFNCNCQALPLHGTAVSGFLVCVHQTTDMVRCLASGDRNGHDGKIFKSGNARRGSELARRILLSRSLPHTLSPTFPTIVTRKWVCICLQTWHLGTCIFCNRLLCVILRLHRLGALSRDWSLKVLIRTIFRPVFIYGFMILY